MSIPTWGHRENPAKNRSTFHVSKSTAVKWVTLGTHEPIDPENMKAGIQAIDPTKKRAIRHSFAYTSYIPDKLPPLEPNGHTVQGIKRTKFYPRILGQTVVPVVLNRRYLNNANA
jgi:hypothetical protein